VGCLLWRLGSYSYTLLSRFIDKRYQGLGGGIMRCLIRTAVSSKAQSVRERASPVQSNDIVTERW